MDLFNKLIDIIYPPRCPICRKFLWKDYTETEKSSPLFCRDCFSDFREITSPMCSVCGTPFVSQAGEDHLCEDCLRKSPFYEIVRAPYLYEGALMTAIYQFKYNSKSFLGEFLGPLMAKFAGTWLEKSYDLLTVPVPLHPKRLRERGFNQSLLLARHVSLNLQTELDFLSLRRIRYTSPQTGLGKKERRKNVRGAFQLNRPELVKGKTVLLVDDVATTGNTLNECAIELKRSGCKKVVCLVLARARKFK
ncbi:MAG TPA: amidophosphoribosyltransferase [Desulfobacteraceae bacterium]|nr:amidophosphoribosyltransferase [Desulfobacteraceae bacterium]